MLVYLGDSLFRRVLQTLHQVPSTRTLPRGQRCIGLCVGGQTINQLTRRLTNNRQQLSDNRVVILIGTNDILQKKLRSPGKIRKVYKVLITKIKRCRPEQILLCTLPPLLRRSQLETDLLHQYNAVIKQVAVEENIQLIDLYSIMEGRPDLFSNDGIHHNRLGMCMIERSIMQM